MRRTRHKAAIIMRVKNSLEIKELIEVLFHDIIRRDMLKETWIDILVGLLSLMRLLLSLLSLLGLLGLLSLLRLSVLLLLSSLFLGL